jgi:hypothetical protein
MRRAVQLVLELLEPRSHSHPGAPLPLSSLSSMRKSVLLTTMPLPQWM